MGIFPTFSEWVTRILTEKKVDAPDYSFDRWIKSVQQLGSQVDSLVGQAKEKESQADKELEKKKKEKPPKEEKPKPDEEKTPFDSKAWNRLKHIAKERKDKETKDGSKGGVS